MKCLLNPRNFLILLLLAPVMTLAQTVVSPDIRDSAIAVTPVEIGPNDLPREVKPNTFPEAEVDAFIDDCLKKLKATKKKNQVSAADLHQCQCTIEVISNELTLDDFVKVKDKKNKDDKVKVKTNQALKAARQQCLYEVAFPQDDLFPEAVSNVVDLQ